MDPYLQVDDLVARYDDRTVLDGVSFVARRGEVTTLLGPSGGGKSTLMRVIIGLKEAAAGRVLIGGRDLHAASEEQHDAILRDIGVAFQGGALFNSMTLLENVCLPLLEHTDVDAGTAELQARLRLSQVGLSHAVHLKPAEISGGMRKRAAVARALALEPALLLLDEPSAGLDPVTARELDELILRLRDWLGIAVVVVTHELLSVETIADRVVMLHGGRVLAAGTLDDVKQVDDPRVRAFFGRERAQGAGAGDNDSLLARISAEGG